LVGWKDKSADAYALIRSIHEDMGMNAAGSETDRMYQSFTKLNKEQSARTEGAK
jgi:hypothetical protein